MRKDQKKNKTIRINFSWFYLLLVGGLFFLLMKDGVRTNPQKIEWPQVQEMVLSGDVKDIHFVRNDFVDSGGAELLVGFVKFRTVNAIQKFCVALYCIRFGFVVFLHFVCYGKCGQFLAVFDFLFFLFNVLCHCCFPLIEYC